MAEIRKFICDRCKIEFSSKIRSTMDIDRLIHCPPGADSEGLFGKPTQEFHLCEDCKGDFFFMFLRIEDQL